MEACVEKPAVKKRPRAPNPPPKPAEINRNILWKQNKPTPTVPPRPKDEELSHTQYRMKITEITDKEEVISTTRVSHRKMNHADKKQASRQTDQSGVTEAPKGETDTEPNAEEHGSEKAKHEKSAETKQDRGGLLGGLFKKTARQRSSSPAQSVGTDSDDAEDEEKMSELSKDKNHRKLLSVSDSLSENSNAKEKNIFSGMFKKTQKPAEDAVTDEDPLSDMKELSDSWDDLTATRQDDVSEGAKMTASNDSLSESPAVTKEKKVGFAGFFKRTPKLTEEVVSFRIKKTIPRILKPNLSSQMSTIEETMELQELIPAQESEVQVQPVEMAPYPTEGNPLDSEEEDDGLLAWWNTVEGWAEWNKTSHLQEEDEQAAMEEAADRVYMGARLFVHLFNQRGASLQQRILELLALADAADQFHKKTVSAAVGGGVASVAGSIATITGLILAPFTFGTSIIVTAVGISVATAGSITSATANITDTVHSNMDRKNMEKMIQSYQEEIKDIRECLEFVQEGMDTLQEWDFDKFSESAAKKALNHNIKHVVKEGGRAGKDLMINTDKLISTVQVLGAAGGAAKAVQAISITTGVMSALFLALDVFFLAKDSHELRKGAKTKFATKIREVCRDLQDGLLELNRVKTQLQKTMDGIEVEEYEEIQEVEEEVDDDLESDPVKLAELEQELDLMEEKLDKRIEEVQKVKENESKKEKKMEKSKNKDEGTGESDSATEKSSKDKGEKISDDEKERSKKKSKAEKPSKEEIYEQKVKKDKKKEAAENKNGKEQKEHKRMEDGSSERVKSEKGGKSSREKERNWLTERIVGKKEEEKGSRSGSEKKEEERGNTSRHGSRSSAKEEERWNTSRHGSRNDAKEEERWNTSRSNAKEEERRNTNRQGSRSDAKEEERWNTSRHGSRSDAKEEERGSSSGYGSRSERGSKDMERWTKKESDGMESWRSAQGERGVRDWRAEMERSKQERRKNEARESKREMEGEGHGKKEGRKEHSEREWRRSREEDDTARSHHHGKEERREKPDRSKTGDKKRESRTESGAVGRRESNREREPMCRVSRSSVLLDDGLYI